MTTTSSPMHSEQFESRSEREQVQERLVHIDGVIKQKTAWLEKAAPFVRELLEVRRKIYEMPSTEYASSLSIDEQWYDDPAYNMSFVHGFNAEGKGGDLTARNGLGYHEGETYDQNEYASKTLEAGQALGFLPTDLPPMPTDPDAINLGIALNETEPFKTPVQAIVLLTAAGLSNESRALKVMDLIKSGVVDTDTIIIASSERPVPHDEKNNEKGRVEAKGYRAGATEFESALMAFNHFAHTDLQLENSEPLLLSGHENYTTGRVVRGEFVENGKLYQVYAFSAPYEEGQFLGYNDKGVELRKNRAGSEDNLPPVLQYLPAGPGLIVQVSHDTWKQSQQAMGDRILGAEGKTVVTVGPDKLDRMTRQPDGSLVLNKPEEVVDEIAKTFRYTAEAKIALENKRAELEARLQR